MTEDKLNTITSMSTDGEAVESSQITKTTPSGAVDQERFNTLATPAAIPQIEVKTGQSSLMDTVRDLQYHDGKTPQVTYQSLVAQTQEAVTKITEIKQLLSSPDVRLKDSTNKILRGKLDHIYDNLQVALTRAGVEYDPTTVSAVQEAAEHPNPMARFLGFLTDGQWQLQNLGAELEASAGSNKELSPINMLAIQVKVTQIQQELELFTSLLSKGLESIKTIMNIQV
jgi:hypothetical protein